MDALDTLAAIRAEVYAYESTRGTDAAHFHICNISDILEEWEASF